MLKKRWGAGGGINDAIPDTRTREKALLDLRSIRMAIPDRRGLGILPGYGQMAFGDIPG